MNILTSFLSNNAIWIVIGGSFIIGFLWGFMTGCYSIHEQGLREYIEQFVKKGEPKEKVYHTLD